MKGYAMGFEKGHESSGKSSKDSKLRKAYMLFSVLAVGLIIFSSFRGGLSGLIQRSTFDEVILIVNFTNFLLQYQLDYLEPKLRI